MIVLALHLIHLLHQPPLIGFVEELRIKKYGALVFLEYDEQETSLIIRDLLLEVLRNHKLCSHRPQYMVLHEDVFMWVVGVDPSPDERELVYDGVGCHQGKYAFALVQRQKPKLILLALHRISTLRVGLCVPLPRDHFGEGRLHQLIGLPDLAHLEANAGVVEETTHLKAIL